MGVPLRVEFTAGVVMVDGQRQIARDTIFVGIAFADSACCVLLKFL